MKRSFLFLPLLLCALSCNIIDQFGTDLSLSVSRQELSSGDTPVWQKGDKLLVLSSTRTSGLTFDMSSGAGRSTASFSGQKPGSAPFYVVIPAGAGTVYSSRDVLSTTIPQKQKHIAGQADPDAFFAAACVYESGSVELKNLCSVLEVPVSGSSRISGIEFIAPEGRSASGKAFINFDGTPRLSFDSGAVSAKIRLDCSGTDAPGKNAVVFRLSLPPSSLSAGAQLCVIDEEGGSMLVDIAAAELDAGEVLTLPQIDYEQQLPPYLSVSTPGIYTVAGGRVTPVYSYEGTRDQLAIVSGKSLFSWRIQSLASARLFSIYLSGKPSEGGVAGLESYGISNAPEGSRTLRTVQRNDGLVWLLDTDGDYLFIINEEL